MFTFLLIIFQDDDQIVKWHWDLISGPIGYEPTLPETSTLQLSDLTAPGNYTFVLTGELWYIVLRKLSLSKPDFFNFSENRISEPLTFI